MKYCPNIECPHAEVVGSPAEYHDQVQVCADCQTPLKWGEPPEPEVEKESPGASLIMVDQFRDLVLAQMIKSNLESEGITVFLQNEHAAYMSMFPTGLQTIGMMVPEPEVQRAREIILGTLDTDPIKTAQSLEHQPRMTATQNNCPQCGSNDIIFYRGTDVVKALARILIFPFFFLKKKTKCKNCGHIWRQEKSESIERTLEDTDAYKKSD